MRGAKPKRLRTRDLLSPTSSLLASRAPSARLSNFAHITCGWTRWIVFALREAAIGAGNHVLASDEVREIDDAVGDEPRMLDRGGVVRDDAGDQDLARRQLHLLPDAPFVLVADIGGLDRIGAGAHLQDQVDDVLERARPRRAARASCRSRRDSGCDLPECLRARG